MDPDWRAIRSEFPSLSNWTYLNSATFGQIPRRAVDAVTRHWKHRDELACGDFLNWYDDADRLRAAIARLIHAAAEDIAFIPNAAAGLALITSGLEWSPGDNIVTLAGEFPNCLYLPALVARYGVELRETPWERFYDSVDERTRMVALSSVNYSTGYRPPLEEISKFLHERGVLLFVDGTQSLGALQFDVRAIRPDALAVHGYKWMISPTGAAFLYVSPDLRRALPPNVIGWRSHSTWREVDSLHHGIPALKESAEKYEGGGLAFPLLYAMEQSVNLMLEIGPDVIERRVLELAKSARERLLSLGAEAADNGSQIVAAKFGRNDVSRLAIQLKERRVLVAARHGHLRVSPHFYNSEEDLDRLEEGIKGLM